MSKKINLYTRPGNISQASLGLSLGLRIHELERLLPSDLLLHPVESNVGYYVIRDLIMYLRDQGLWTDYLISQFCSILDIPINMFPTNWVEKVGPVPPGPAVSPPVGISKNKGVYNGKKIN